MNLKKFIALCALLTSCINSPNKKIAIISIPKCGTHLLKPIIEELTGKKERSAIGPDNQYNWLTLSQNKTINISNQEYLWGHTMASKENIDLLAKHKYKVIFIYRDPRDQLVSLAHFMQGYTTWGKKNLPIDKIISDLIANYSDLYCPDADSGWCSQIVKNLRSISDFYSLYLPWMKQSFVYPVRFESLIGNDQISFNEIQNIIKFLNIQVSENKLFNVINKIHGKSWTFRSGKIGEWKKEFTIKQKELFKTINGQLLIDLKYEKDTSW